MKKITKNNYYWTFSELVTTLDNAGLVYVGDTHPYSDETALDFDNFVSGLPDIDYSKLSAIYDYNSGDQTYSLKEFVNEIYNELYTRHYKDYVLCASSDLELDENELEYIATRIIMIFQRTYDKYACVLNIYKNNKANLMNALKNKSVVKQNDTPQAINNSFDGDNYVSYMTTSETESDIATIMSRIKEIENAYSMVVNNWVDEFDSCFLSKENIDYER